MLTINKLINLLVFVSRLTRSHHLKPSYCLFLTLFSLIKLKLLLKMKLKLYCTSEEIFHYLIMKHKKCNEIQVDNNLYILCNSKTVDTSKNWFYLCCPTSKKKCKVFVLFTDDIPENTMYTSENLKNNIQRQLKFEKIEQSSFFLVSAPDQISYATEIKISLINSPHNCSNEFINILLKNFFSYPKYLRLNDIFSVNVKKYNPETKYCTADFRLKMLYFKVNAIKNENLKSNDTTGFSLYGKTTLIQEVNVHSFIPCDCLCNIPAICEKKFIIKWSPALEEPLKQLQSCIAPFLHNDIKIDIKPVFLVEGSVGTGKSQLVPLTAASLGLHFLKADFAEVQSLTSAQTEAKLRIIFHDAENCAPCLLLLENIQIFGINSEGQKDERVLAAFTTEIEKLYSKKQNYPIIIIATSNDPEIPIDSEKSFIEKIIINHLEFEQRCKILSWLIESKGWKHEIDIPKIAKVCSDFVLADFETLVLHAIKNHCMLCACNEKTCETILTDKDFDYANECIQSVFSDRIGGPRVPKVYWEDIGGLADLKKEIMRRIEMPLLNIPGMSKSGLLLYGPPGTGKTLLAKAVATECQLNFLSVKGPELLNMYVGQSEKNVRQVFERARASSPCIIFFDELDSLAPNRGQSGDSGGVMDRVVSQLLAEMDGLDNTGSVLIMAATNRPDLIDPALLRPGRFDRMLYVGVYADILSQVSVLKALTRRFKLERDGKELEEVVQRLPRTLTGADLYGICSGAWLRAVRRIMMEKRKERENLTVDDVVVSIEDFLEVSKEVVPSVSREELRRYEVLKEELSSR